MLEKSNERMKKMSRFDKKKPSESGPGSRRKGGTFDKLFKGPGYGDPEKD